jgi:hypothetical protein
VHVSALTKTPGIDAALEAGGAINGTVVDEEQAPLEGICVSAHHQTPYGPQHAWETATDANGQYSLSGLATDTYLVRFNDCENSPALYVEEWYDDVRSDWDFDIQPVDIVAGSKESNVDAELGLAGKINGIVTDAKGLVVLPDVCVNVYDEDYRPVSDALTDESGAYEIDQLSAGQYKISFADCSPSRLYLGEWYDDQPAFDSAALIKVTGGDKTANVNAGLAIGGSINGTVTAALDGGGPLNNICVEVYDADFEFHMASGQTDEQGNYSIGGLPGGAYKVNFVDCGPAPQQYAFRWYGDSLGFDAAAEVAVTASVKTPDIDIKLLPAGMFSGTVRDEGTGDPLENICVYAYRLHNGAAVSSALTDGDGNYVLGGLAGGESYKLWFSDCFSQTYAAEWYNDKRTMAAADAIPAVGGTETPDNDAELALAGSINGTVTDEVSGEPLSSVCVWVYDLDGTPVGFNFTDENGNYTIGLLYPGDYKIEFFECFLQPVHLDEWYDDAGDFDSATPVTVRAGGKVTADVALAIGGTINGVVTEAGSGQQLNDICVRALDSTTNMWASFATTDGNGAYSLTGLPTGSYKVGFHDCRDINTPLAFQWYDGEASSSTADLVAVTAGEKSGPINAALTAGGSISGTVTNEGDDPLAGIAVWIHDDAGLLVGLAVTNMDGLYVHKGLASGQYRLRFQDINSQYGEEWYDDEASLGTATEIAVTAPNETAGVDAVLSALP